MCVCEYGWLYFLVFIVVIVEIAPFECQWNWRKAFARNHLYAWYNFGCRYRYFSFLFSSFEHTHTLNDRISIYFIFVIWSNRRIHISICMHVYFVQVLFFDYTQMSVCKRFDSNWSWINWTEIQSVDVRLVCVRFILVYSFSFQFSFFCNYNFIQYFMIMIMSLFFSDENFYASSFMTRSRKRINNCVYVRCGVRARVCVCVYVLYGALYASVYMFSIVAIMIYCCSTFGSADYYRYLCVYVCMRLCHGIHLYIVRLDIINQIRLTYVPFIRICFIRQWFVCFFVHSFVIWINQYRICIVFIIIGKMKW